MPERESKNVRLFRESKLQEGEEILASADGYVGKMMGQGANKQYNGSLVITNRRVAFYARAIVLVQRECFRSIPIADIIAVEHNGGIVEDAITLRASGASLALKGLGKDQCQACVDAINAAMQKHRAPQTITPPPDTADQLRKLAELVKEGILSEDDWEQAKAAYLGKPDDKRQEAVRLLRSLYDLTQHGALTESEFRQRKWDILSNPR